MQLETLPGEKYCSKARSFKHLNGICTVHDPMHYLCLLQVFSTYVHTECVIAGEEIGHAKWGARDRLGKTKQNNINMMSLGGVG